MTGLNLLMKRMMVENENLRNALEGKEIKPVPRELMTKDEIKVYEETGKQESLLTTGDFIRHFAGDNYKAPVSKEVIKDVKEITINKEKEETEQEPKVEQRWVNPKFETKKDESIEQKKTEEEEKIVTAEEIKDVKEKENNEEFSMKDTVDFIKKGLHKIEGNILVKDDEKSEDVKKDIQETADAKEEPVDKSLEKKVELVKTKIANIVKDVKDRKPTDTLIKDYSKLSASKKKIAIANMIKEIANTVAQEKKCDISDVINFGVNIESIARQHNKREYNVMLKTLKETLSKMTSNELIKGIIERLDVELKNTIILNKIKFVSYIRNMNTDFDLTEENLNQVLADLDSIGARLNNGEDFDKILKSFNIDNTENPEDNHIEAKVVDTDEDKAEEETNDESTNMESSENVFLTMDEVDSLASTMNEVLMGI